MVKLDDQGKIMLQKESMIFYHSWVVAIETIADPFDRLDAFQSIVDYGMWGIEPGEKTDPSVMAIFELVKPFIDRNARNYKRQARRRKMNREES